MANGRNDPWACGSGKKYKKCCLLAADGAEFQFWRLRQTHAKLIPKLTEFAFQTLPPELFKEAWTDFNDRQEVGDWDPVSHMNVLFMPWFLFNWTVGRKSSESTERTIAEQFLINHLDQLTSDEQTLLISSSRCSYALCEVAEVKPGVGMTLFDLLRRIRFEVVDRSASLTLKRGEIIYCATSDVSGFKSNVVTGPYALMPTAKREILRLRQWILNQSGSFQLTTEHLHEFECDTRRQYLLHVKAMLSPPQLANTDGDLMVPQKLYFELESAQTAFHALKSLAKGRKEKELLSQAEMNDGLVVKIQIDWLGGKPEAIKRLGGPVLLGRLKIDHEQLIVEVNSNERAARIRKLIENRLGSGVKYKTTLIEPIESQVGDAWQVAAGGASVSGASSRSAISIDEESELRAMFEEAAKAHWDSWFDLPVPALDGMTPREAAQTEEGRDLLESLLLFYENRDGASAENLYRADAAWLRRELEID